MFMSDIETLQMALVGYEAERQKIQATMAAIRSQWRCGSRRSTFRYLRHRRRNRLGHVFQFPADRMQPLPVSSAAFGPIGLSDKITPINITKSKNSSVLERNTINIHF